MTTRTITGAYANGYSLNANYSGLIIGSTASVGGPGVYSNHDATVLNFGAVNALYMMFGGGFGGAGVHLAAGGSVTNGSVSDTVALIGGYYDGVIATGTSVAIANFGTIQSAAVQSQGVFLEAGGSVTNGSTTDTKALIKADYGGVYVRGASAAIVNFGTIQSSSEGPTVQGCGVALYAGGAVTNGSATDTSALIYGGVGGEGSAAMTVTNFGTIDGPSGAAVQFNSAADVLIAYGGSTFIGAVDGGGGTLELATGSGTISGTVSASGAVAETVGATTTTFSNFGALVLGSSSQFTVAATLTNSGSVVQSGILTMTGGTITNENGATWNIANGLDPTAAAGTFYNAGELAKTVGTGLVHVGVDFYNDYLGTVGVVDISLGALDFIGASNVFFGLVTGGGALVLGGGSSSLDGVLAVATVEVQGASTSVTVDEALSYSGVWAQTGGYVSVASGDKLTLTGTGDSLNGALTGAGTVDFSGGSDTFKTLTLSAAHLAITKAAVTLEGSINLTGALTATTADLIVASGGAVLGGGGTLVLSNSASNSIEGASATARLTNEDKIQGAGQLGGGQMSLLNEATGLIIGADALDLVINTGAETIANAGLIESAGTGGVTIDSAIDNSGTLTAAKGTLTAFGAVSGAGKVFIEGGTADFQSTFAQSVTFTAAGGELELAKSQTYTGTITGFSKTTKTSLDLLDIAFGTGTKATYSGNTAAGVLTVTNGTHTAKIKLAGNYTTSTFTVSSDGHGGTKVVDPPGTAQQQSFIAAMAGFGADGAAQAGAAAETSWGAIPVSATLAKP